MTNTDTKTKPAFLTRNYLTLIIALIVLVCATLGLALVFAAPSLDVFQQWFLILTLIFFPIFSISMVTWLILRHSNKLSVAEKDAALLWETTSAEKQKRKLNSEVRELAKHLEIPVEQMGDLRSAYIVAEDLALRKVQSEANVPLLHKISIGNADFDAIYIDEDLITCVEVTFVVSDDVDQDKIHVYLRKAAAAKSHLTKIRTGSRVRLLIVLVTQIDEKFLNELRSNVRRKFTETPVNVDIRFLDFQSLQNIYAED